MGNYEFRARWVLEQARGKSLFPDEGVWREGHCGIPFLHWFPKGSRLDFREWLDSWTYYRTRREIDAAYDKYFRDVRHIEDYWPRSRLGGLKKAAAWLPASAQRLVVRKLAGMIFVARKPA